MIRTILIIGVLMLFLLAFAIKAAVVGLIVYGIIRLVSPETAHRIRARLSPSRP